MVGMAYNVLKSPKELKPHNLNVEIYGNESVDMDLVESIQKKGILEPLVIRDDNTILSGHRRWLASKHLKIDKIPCRTITFDNNLDEKEALIEFNRQREKTHEQRVREGKQLKGIYVERAKLEMVAASHPNKKDNVARPTLDEQECKEITKDKRNINREAEYKRRTDTKVAEEVGLKRTTYTKTEELVDKADAGNKLARDLLDKVNTNTLTVNAASETMKISDKAKEGGEKAQKVLKSVLEGDMTPRKALQNIKKVEDRETTPIIKTPPLPVDKFDIIYADPPWKYDFAETDNRKIENHYGTMELVEIKALRVPSADNSVVLMWATAPKLIEAIELMKSWEFEYITCAVWDKEKIGMGYWFRGQHEMLLVGRKGIYSPPVPENRYSSVIRKPRTAHSEKPICVYDMIEKMFPNGKYLEMFARHKHNDKWEAWGNEI